MGTLVNRVRKRHKVSFGCLDIPDYHAASAAGKGLLHLPAKVWLGPSTYNCLVVKVVFSELLRQWKDDINPCT